MTAGSCFARSDISYESGPVGHLPGMGRRSKDSEPSCRCRTGLQVGRLTGVKELAGPNDWSGRCKTICPESHGG